MFLYKCKKHVFYLQINVFNICGSHLVAIRLGSKADSCLMAGKT